MKRIYGNKDIRTEIGRKKVENLLLLYTENFHFTFGNNIYQQKDGVSVRFPLGQALAGILMVHLKKRSCQN